MPAILRMNTKWLNDVIDMYLINAYNFVLTIYLFSSLSFVSSSIDDDMKFN